MIHLKQLRHHDRYLGRDTVCFICRETIGFDKPFVRAGLIVRGTPHPFNQNLCPNCARRTQEQILTAILDRATREIAELHRMDQPDTLSANGFLMALLKAQGLTPVLVEKS